MRTYTARCILTTLGAATLLLSIAGDTLAEDHGETAIPELIESIHQNAEAPTWVGVNKLAPPDEKGELDWSLLPSYSQETFESYFVAAEQQRVGAPEGECGLYFGAHYSEKIGALPNSSFADLSRESSAVVRGVVRSFGNGFFEGRPGVLLRAELLTSLRTSSRFSPVSHFFVFLPQADFYLREDRVCAKDNRFPSRPSVGEQILVFVYADPQDRPQLIIAPTPTEILVEDHSGKVRASPSLKNDLDILVAESLEELESFIASDSN